MLKMENTQEIEFGEAEKIADGHKRQFSPKLDS